ncbi:YfjI family protein [Metabacillus endolithicus]|uniref:YfjI family protein n=1 Tax=Metabacillus endolithicus TaxID=1535204 RepID=UPI001FFAFCAD|nr:YfjI family protein [Metabacillus endolithicus]UPG61663.1 YfjI family protein [Metabacillus endolithicus]
MTKENVVKSQKEYLTVEKKLAMQENRKKSEGNTELFNDVVKALETDRVSKPSLSEEEEWAMPVTFDEYDTIPFPIEIFPTTIQNMVKAVAIDTQTPIDLAAMVCIGVLSTALSKKFAIEPKAGWKEPLNTYTATLLPSGLRKSAVYNATTKPLYEYALELHKEMKSKIDKRKLKRQALEKRIDKLQTDFAKTNNPELLQEIEAISDELQRHPELSAPKLTVDNETSENLVIELKKNNEKISIMSPEGDLFIKFNDPTEKGKHDVYLKGYSGDHLQVGRVSRPGEILTEPLLTICIVAQPTVVQNFPSYVHERGIPARFLFSMPNDNQSFREPFPPSTAVEISRAYKELIRKLLMFTPNETICLRLSEDSINILKDLIMDIEKEFRDNGIFEGHLRFWGSKLVGQILRVAGLLHVAHSADSSNLEEITSEVSLDIIKKAFLLKDYFITHAQKVFGVMKRNDTFNDAIYLRDKILNEKKLVVDKQTIHQKTKKRIQGKDRFSRAYDLLEYHSYIKQVKGGKYGNKGMILVNPALLKNDSH